MATFFTSFGLIFLNLIFILRLMCLICLNIINTTKNSCGKCLCITSFILDILTGILIIIAEITILKNMYDKYKLDDDHISDSVWVCVYVSLSCFEIALIIHFYCVNFLIKLIRAKTDSSYLEYLEKKEEDSIRERNRAEINNTQNNLKFNNIQLTINQVPQNPDKGK